MNSTKLRTLASVLYTLFALGGFISLWFPYLAKLNVVFSDDPRLQNMIVNGYDYQVVYLILFLMVASIFTVRNSKRHTRTLAISLLILGLTYLLRLFIHSQGSIDHDYDSKTGSGFLLLVILAMGHFILSGTLFLSAVIRKNDRG